MTLTAVTQGYMSFPGCLVTVAKEESFPERCGEVRWEEVAPEFSQGDFRTRSCQRPFDPVSGQDFPSSTMGQSVQREFPRCLSTLMNIQCPQKTTVIGIDAWTQMSKA